MLKEKRVDNRHRQSIGGDWGKCDTSIYHGISYRDIVHIHLPGGGGQVTWMGGWAHALVYNEVRSADASTCRCRSAEFLESAN